MQMQCTPKIQSRCGSVACYALFKGGKGKAKAAAKKEGKAGWLGSGEVSDLENWYGPDRRLFLPDGFWDRENAPEWCDGTLPGDYGYDILRLGQNSERVAKFRVNELLHCRWAMLAAAGMIIPEGLAASGADIKGAVWFETGAAMLGGETLNYFAVPWGIYDNPLPLVGAIVVELGLMAAVELYRARGTGPGGYSPGVGAFESSVFEGADAIYPGGPFDPLGLSQDPEVFDELKVKEIKNGRLAMVSVLGFAVQGYVTGEGPYANWIKHVSDPFGYNLFTLNNADPADLYYGPL